MARGGPVGVTVTSRALAVLAAFDDDHRRLTMSEIAVRTGIPTSTTHRLVAELSSWGALERTSSDHYVVGRRLWSIGLLAPVQQSIVETASPYLHDLYAVTMATVHLAVRQDLEVLYLDRLGGNSSLPIVSTTGSTLPLHATGVGKVLLAHAPEDVVDQVLSNLDRMTPFTIVHPGRMRRQLAQIRVDGFASTAEEMTLGACSVAVPIWRGDVLVASLGVVVPSLQRKVPQLLAALRVASSGIGRALTRQFGL